MYAQELRELTTRLEGVLVDGVSAGTKHLLRTDIMLPNPRANS